MGMALYNLNYPFIFKMTEVNTRINKVAIVISLYYMTYLIFTFNAFFIF